EILKQLGGPYIEAVQTGYGRLAEAANQAAQTSENAKVLNLYRLYETFAGQVFQSPISLTDEANTVLADQVYAAIAADLALTPRPFLGTPP
ncbi:MAG: SGNH/GDSL hydrolase family protein, partial [Cyanothece sp. SIO1E1]|nr:SGNH/GDSL hydrolase family protein [Cyanothece sp. SIO1E1]